MRDLGIAFSLQACTQKFDWRNKLPFGGFFYQIATVSNLFAYEYVTCLIRR